MTFWEFLSISIRAIQTRLSPYITNLEDAYTKLQDFPLLGSRCDEQCRAFVVHNHIVFYAFDDTRNTVRIITIIDGRREIPTILDDI